MISDAPYPNRLAECMKVAGLTDPRLADLSGTTKQQIFKLRRGERNLTVQWAKRLAPHLGVSWQELVDASPGPPPDQARTALLAAYEAMGDAQRQVLLQVAEMMVSPQTPDEKPPPDQRPKRRPAA